MAVKLGSAAFIDENNPGLVNYDTGTHVHLLMNNIHMGSFSVSNHYRSGLGQTAHQIKDQQYELHVLSGDHDAEKNNLQQLFGRGMGLYSSP